jgi:D-apiose dehydrogenase
MRFGLVGLGWATRSFQLPALEKVPGAEVVGGVDSSPEQLENWRRETGTPGYESLEEMLEGARPDVVVVATPPGSHADIAIQALEAGAHVFCEKPFVSNVDEADRVIAAAESAGRQVAVNHEFREKPIFRALRERIESGQAGRLVFAQIWQLMDLAPWDEPVKWRREMPERTLFEGGVHLVDLLMMLFGEVPEAVYARHSSGYKEGGADAIHLVTFEFSGGRLGQITIDRLCRAGTRYVEIRADCEEASLRASLGGRAQVLLGKKRAEGNLLRVDYASGGLAWEERGESRKTLAKAKRPTGMHATAALLGRIVPALEENREPPSSAREARNVLAVIEAAYESARTGTRVEVFETVETPAFAGGAAA